MAPMPDSPLVIGKYPPSAGSHLPASIEVLAGEASNSTATRVLSQCRGQENLDNVAAAG
jgi:hypothetical protein